MNKTLIVGLALAVVALGLWYSDSASNSATVDAQQALRAAGNRMVALLDVGDLRGFFTEVSGLGSESEVTEFRDGGDASHKVRKIPGRLKYDDITLKRGITSNMDIWTWRKMVEDGEEGFRKDGSLTLFNQNRQPVAKWNFENAWPKKVTGPSPKADGNEVGVEEITIVHEFIERIQ